jgi:hypothetical protein
MECYSGTYLLHAFLSGVAFIVLIVSSVFITTTFYEQRYIQNNPLCKTNGRNDLNLVMFKIVLVMMFSFLDVSDIRIFVVIVIAVFAFIQFISLNTNAVYLNQVFSKIINTQYVIILWTVIMLIFGLFVEGTYYQGIPYQWVFGTPLLICIVMFRKEYNYGILMVDSNRFDSLNQAV